MKKHFYRYSKTQWKHWDFGMKLTKGSAWNILAKDFDVNTKYHILTKTNMVREFGEFLPTELKPKKKTRELLNPVHQSTQFFNWN